MKGHMAEENNICPHLGYVDLWLPQLEMLEMEALQIWERQTEES